MTTATLTRGAAGTAPGYGFRSAAQMEWLKLRSVRSTTWTGLVFGAAMIGLAILALGHEHWASMSAPTAPLSTRSSRASPAWPSASWRSACSARW